MKVQSAVISGVGKGQPIEGGIDLHGVEEGGVVLEPPARRQALRIDEPPPVLVVPPRAADVYRLHASSAPPAPHTIRRSVFARVRLSAGPNSILRAASTRRNRLC